MSIPVKENVKKTYIPQVPYKELSKDVKEMILNYKEVCELKYNESFKTFIDYLILTMYITPEDKKQLYDIIAEAKPELVQKLMAAQGTEILEINLGYETDQLILTLPIILLNDIYTKLKDFIIFITDERAKKGLIQLNDSDYSKFIDKEFLKIFKIWLHPERQLRGINLPMLIKNEPEAVRIIQEKTAPIKKEVTIVDDTSSKEKLKQRMKEDEEDNNEEEDFLEIQKDNLEIDNRQKTDLNKITLDSTKAIITESDFGKRTKKTSHEKLTLDDRYDSNKKPVVTDYESNYRSDFHYVYGRALTVYNMGQARKERRSNLMKEKRLKTLYEYEESLKEQNKDDLKKVESEKK